MPEDLQPIDEDLYCLKCGYNLRGLTGAIVRCPECGSDNPVAGIDVPENFINAATKKLKKDLASATAALLIALPFQIAFWWILFALFAGGRFADPWSLLCLAVPAFGGAGLWLYSCVRFRQTCMDDRDWLKTLVLHHLWMLAQVVPSIGAIALMFWIALSSFGSNPINIVPVALITIAIGGLVAMFLRWSNQRVRAYVLKQHRTTIVSLARTELRRQLRRKRRWS
jgi:hypothetical protein